MTTAKKRIYVVEIKYPTAEGEQPKPPIERLIRASRNTRAELHAAAPIITARTATQNDLERLLPKCKVEEADEEADGKAP